MIVAGWLVALLSGLWQLWWGRFHIIGDSISYLDIGDAWLRGDWSTAVNAYWSPLYSWLLGAALAIVRPSAYWEIAVIAGVRFAVYLFALASFQFFWTTLYGWCEEQRTGPGLPAQLWMTLGFVVWIWASLRLVTISNVTPDMCLAAFVFLASGLLLRFAAKQASWMPAAGLGAALGFGYLTKAPMFPLAAVFLACSLFARGAPRRTFGRVLLAASIFVLIAGPFVAALSMTKKRFTFGDSGRINYAWDVNNVPKFGWRGGPPELGTPVHPPRVLTDSPATFEYSSGLPVTNPFWYDPSYWYQGLTPRFSLAGMMTPVRESADFYLEVFLEQHGLIVGMIAACLLAGWRAASRDWLRLWPLWTPAAVGVGMFTVAGTEGRYVAAFLVVLIGAAFAVIHRVANDVRSVTIVLAAALLVMAAQLALTMARPDVPGRQSHVSAAVAAALQRADVRRGDRVAVIRGGLIDLYWARLAGVQVTVQVPAEASRAFWFDADARERSLGAMAATGVRAVVAQDIPPGVPRDGWTALGDSRLQVYLLH